MKKTLIEISAIVGICIAGIVGVTRVSQQAADQPPAVVMPARPESPAPVKLDWLIGDRPEYKQALKVGEDMNRFVIVDFAPSWCEPCHKFWREFLSRNDVAERLGAEFALVQVHEGDVLRSFDNKFHWDAKYGFQALPRIAVIAPNGDVRDFQPNVKDPESFWGQLDDAVSHLKGK